LKRNVKITVRFNFESNDAARERVPVIQSRCALNLEALTATVNEQASQIQKVSAQIEVGKRLPQTALNNQ
jgi:hypothetical protein